MYDSILVVKIVHVVAAEHGVVVGDQSGDSGATKMGVDALHMLLPLRLRGSSGGDHFGEQLAGADTHLDGGDDRTIPGAAAEWSQANA